MIRWLALVTLLLTAISPASANGAMGLVYGSFQWNYWLLYVAITVVFEALVFGRWANIPFFGALGISLGANATTGVLGAGFSGIFGYSVHSIGGKDYGEPNPLVHTLFCLVVGGVVSALIEAIFWTKVAGRSSRRLSLLVHLAGVPLALLILLLPPRPYVGLENQTNFRRNFVKKAIASALGEAIRGEESRPFYAPKNWDELIKQALPSLSQREHQFSSHVLEVARFRPHFARFDVGEMRREPCEFNPALMGKDLKKLKKPEWLVRWTSNGWIEGIVIEEMGEARHLPDLKTWLQNRKKSP